MDVTEENQRARESKLYTFNARKIKHQVGVVNDLSQEVRDVIGHLQGLCQLDRFNQSSIEKQHTVLKTLVGIRKNLIKISAQSRRLQREEQKRHTEDEELGWQRGWIRVKNGGDGCAGDTVGKS